MKLSVKRVFRISIYALLITAIVYVTVILVAIGQGYHFNWRTGQLESGGLVLVETKPDGAQIQVDGEHVKKAAPARLSLLSGEHDIKLQQANYRLWEKKVTVTKSLVSWLKYPLLIPEQIPQQDLFKVNGLSNFQQTPDRRYLSLVIDSKEPQVLVLEIGQTDPVTVYNLPRSLITQGFKIANLSWAPDSRHFMLTLVAGKDRRHLVLDRGDSNFQIDIESKTTIDEGELQFSGDNWQKLFWLNAGELRTIDLETSKASPVLAKNITDLKSWRDRTFIVQNVGSTSQLTRLGSDGMTHTIVSNLPKTGYQIDYGVWSDRQYLAILNLKDGIVSLYNPESESQQSVGRFDTVHARAIFTSPDSRLLVMQDGNSFAVYDFDLDRLFRFEIKGHLDKDWSWFDNYHLLVTRDAQTTLFEFDGQNLESLGTSVPAWPSFASRDRELVYQIAADSKSNLVLRRLTLLLGR